MLRFAHPTFYQLSHGPTRIPNDGNRTIPPLANLRVMKTLPPEGTGFVCPEPSLRPMKILLLPVFALLLVASCSRKAKKANPIQPAADPVTAAATSFTTSLTEVRLDERGTIATGTIRTNAPLASATDGSYSLSPQTAGTVSYPGQAVTSRLAEKRDGKIRVRQSGDQTILELLTSDGEPLLRIIGPPHGNGIRGSWFFEGTESGQATLTPGRTPS